jgi:hypothetical protein
VTLGRWARVQPAPGRAPSRHGGHLLLASLAAETGPGTLRLPCRGVVTGSLGNPTAPGRLGVIMIERPLRPGGPCSVTVVTTAADRLRLSPGHWQRTCAVRCMRVGPTGALPASESESVCQHLKFKFNRTSSEIPSHIT